MKVISTTALIIILNATLLFSQNMTRFEKYGVKDSTGKIIVEPKYDYISDVFRDGIAIVRIGEKWGAINVKGQEIISVKYDLVDNRESGILKVQIGLDWEKRKFGLFDTNGNQLLDTIYNDFEFNKYGVAVISLKNGFCGLLNRDGKILMPVKFKTIEFNPDNSYLGLVNETETSCFYIDSTGKKVSQTYDEGSMFNNGLAQVKLNNKWGAINEKGKLIVPFKYDEKFDFNGDLAKVKQNNKYGLISTKGKEIVPFKYDFIDIDNSFNVIDVSIYDKRAVLSHGLLSINGKEIIPVKYHMISMVDSNLIAVTSLQVNVNENTGEPLNSYTLGFLNKSGKEIVPQIYSESWSRISNIKNNSKALVVSLNGKQGIIDYFGKELIPFKYDSFKVPEYNPDNLYGIAAYQNNKLGIINRNGDLITPVQYDDIRYDFDGHGICKYALVERNKKWGCVSNVTGKELIPTKYEKIQFIGIGNDPNFDTTDIATVKFCMVTVGMKIDTLYSYEEFEKLNSSNTWEMLSDEYVNDTIRRIIVKGGGKYGLVDFEGKELTAIEYDQARVYFHNGLLPVKRNGKWGYINELGVEVIPTIYDPINGFEGAYYFDGEGKALVRLDGRDFYIGKDGKEIK